MNYKIRHTQRVVILFVAVPLVLLVATIVMIAIRQNLFEKRHTFHTTLQNATGVSTQTPILYKGYEIGKVNSFKLSPNGNIEVEFYVLDSYKQAMVDPSVMLRQNNPLTGKTTLEFVRDPQSRVPLKEKSSIPSTDFPEGKVLLKRISPAHTDQIAGIIQDVSDLTNELGRDNNPDAGSVFRTLYNVANATEKMDASLAKMQTTIAELNTFMTNLNRDNNAEAGAIFRILNNVADITQALEKETGQIDQLLQSTNIAMKNYSDPDSLVIKMIDPKGDTIIKPLSNMLVTLNASLREAQSILQVANRNNPELLMLITNLNETMAHARKTLEAVNNNPLLRGGITPTSAKSSNSTIRMSEFPDE
ncbi:MAG TPA: MlaD family protein [Candidatus Cloacimonadota bacterium]|nr:MlaD family protein [Candidatus Cloacimonadota bacterium]